MVSVVGHTFNPHSWLPSTRRYGTGQWSSAYHSSLGWVDELIIHDDNFGMQFCLPAHAFKPVGNPDEPDDLTPREALGIFPTSFNIKMLSTSAETIAASVMRQMAKESQGAIFAGNYYTERFWSSVTNSLRESTIFRTLLVRWSEYVERYWKDGPISAELQKFLEEIDKKKITHVWLVEITEPVLFIGKKAKVFDILLYPHIAAPEFKDASPGEEMELPQGTLRC